jgi:hypothetical protein
MLSIGKLGTGQESYYLEKVAEGAEDYIPARARRRATGLATPPATSAWRAKSKVSS